MKKFYVFAAVAIAALASCTKSEVVYNQGQQEIGFRQFTGSMTKATNLSTLEGGPTTMGVFAHIYNSTPYQTYFSNAKFVKKVDNNWGGETSRYWPLQDSLDFTLYAPYVDGTTYKNDTKKLTVAVANNTTAQQDFMYGTQRYIRKKKPASGGVPVVLKHALSKVSVKIGSNVGSLFTVTKVEIVNSIQNGSFVVTYNDASTDIAVTPGATKGTVETYSNTAGTVLTTSEEGISFGSKLVFPLAPIAENNVATNEARLRITYNMGDATGLKAEVKLSDAWESGKHYIYNVTLTATEILLTPTVEEWPDASTSDIEINS